MPLPVVDPSQLTKKGFTDANSSTPSLAPTTPTGPMNTAPGSPIAPSSPTLPATPTTQPPNTTGGKAPDGYEWGPTGKLQPIQSSPLIPTGGSNPGVVTSQGYTPPGAAASPTPGAPSAGPNTDILTAILGSTQAPTPPDLTKILTASNIPQLQGNLSSIQQAQLQLQNAFKEYRLNINGQGTPQGIVDVLSDQKAKNMQIQMDTLNESASIASSNLSNAMTWVQEMMTMQQTDYTNAVTAYNDTFDRAYKFQTLYNTAATTQQQNASAYLGSVATMIGTSGVDWNAMSPVMKATIQQKEAQAGWPAGTLQSFAKIKPGANILGTINGVDPTTGQNTTSFIYSDPTTGKPGVVSTIVLPSKPVSIFSPYGPDSSSSSTGYDGGILDGTNLDPQAFVRDIVSNPTQMSALFGAMAQAEGGAKAAGASVNNPLDLKFNANMAKLGATDSGIKAQDGGTFSAFADQATASRAYATLLSSPSYANLTLDQALQKWSGATSSSGSSSQNANVQAWVTAIQNGNATMAQVPNTGPDRGLKDAVSQALTNTDQTSYSPLAASRFTTAANRIVSNFIELPQYQLTANGLPYLQRIDAAMKTPGSVSDQDLLDSLTKLNTAGNAISDAQVKLITDGQSFKDMAGAFANKFKNGGVLSDNQRQQIQKIATAIYANYKKGYQPVYDQATAQLQAAGIPKAFWTIPDLNSLGDKSGVGSGSSQSINIGGQSYNVGSTISVGGTSYLINADGTVTPQ